MSEGAAIARPLGGSDAAVFDPGSTADGTANPCVYKGITVRETAGSTAVLRIRQGSVTGVILDTISLAANQSVTTWYDDGKYCNGAVFEDTVSGAYEGSVFVV